MYLVVFHGTPYRSVSHKIKRLQKPYFTLFFFGNVHLHNKLKMHLHKKCLHKSGLSDFCEEPETVKHLLYCLKYQHYQENVTDFAIKSTVNLAIELIIYDYVLKSKQIKLKGP